MDGAIGTIGALGNPDELLAIIRWRIRPSVASRLPGRTVRKGAIVSQTLNALRLRARPFRLMDVPAEIRIQIYSSFLKSLGLAEVVLDKGLFPLPKLAHTSRQVRSEFLPLYYKTSNFALRLDEPCSPLLKRLSNADRVSTMNDWISMIGPDSAKLLRNLSIEFPHVKARVLEDDMLSIKLALVNGKLEIHVTDHCWLTPDSLILLREHATTISKMAQSLGFQGQALVMMFTCCQTSGIN